MGLRGLSGTWIVGCGRREKPMVWGKVAILTSLSLHPCGKMRTYCPVIYPEGASQVLLPDRVQDIALRADASVLGRHKDFSICLKFIPEEEIFIPIS